MGQFELHRGLRNYLKIRDISQYEYMYLEKKCTKESFYECHGTHSPFILPKQNDDVDFPICQISKVISECKNEVKWTLEEQCIAWVHGTCRLQE